MDAIAVVRLRGAAGINPNIEKTLLSLRLKEVNNCAVERNTPSFQGMVKQCKDWVAYGKISPEMLAKLIAKRGRKEDNKTKSLGLPAEKIAAFVKEWLAGTKQWEDIGMKQTFRLTPPKKGHKGGIKKLYPAGAAGKRPDMDSLVSRMM